MKHLCESLIEEEMLYYVFKNNLNVLLLKLYICKNFISNCLSHKTIDIPIYRYNHQITPLLLI